MDAGRIISDEILPSFVNRPSPGAAKTLIVGLGNPLLGDDGVGWRVAEEVERRLPKSVQTSEVSGPVEIDCLSLGGLSLMERMIGYDRVILIDSIETGQRPTGSVRRFALDELPDPTAGHSASAHDTSLLTALQMGRAMGVALPDRVIVVAIESPHVYDFSE